MDKNGNQIHRLPVGLRACVHGSFLCVWSWYISLSKFINVCACRRLGFTAIEFPGRSEIFARCDVCSMFGEFWGSGLQNCAYTHKRKIIILDDSLGPRTVGAWALKKITEMSVDTHKSPAHPRVPKPSVTSQQQLRRACWYLSASCFGEWKSSKNQSETRLWTQWSI